MPRSLQNPALSNAIPQPPGSNAPSARILGMSHAGSRITALNMEFVAKPSEVHKMHAVLPAAIHGAFGEVAGFVGSFVMIANHEARLVTVITLWRGEDGTRRCDENVRRVRALLTPYIDRCLRVRSSAVYLPRTTQVSPEFGQNGFAQMSDNELNEEETVCVS